jgi:hypothetical protein
MYEFYDHNNNLEQDHKLIKPIFINLRKNVYLNLFNLVIITIKYVNVNALVGKMGEFFPAYNFTLNVKRNHNKIVDQLFKSLF